MRTTTRSALLSCLLPLPLFAQHPFGHATPVAGQQPELFAEPFWFGSPSFGYRVEQAPPTGVVAVAVSAARLDGSALGLQLYPSLLPQHFLLAYLAVTDGNGRAVISTPFMTPETPALAGVDLFAQAVVLDPVSAAFGASQGLLLEASLHPLLAFATAQLQLCDPVFGTTTPVAGLPAIVTLYECVFGAGGRDLYVGTNQGLFVVDTLAAAPTAVLLLPGVFNSLAWDRVRQRLFANYGYLSTIYVVDGNRASAAFGASVAQINQFATWIALPTDGRVLATSTFMGPVTRIDVDPTSTQYLQPIPTAPSPVPFSYGIGPTSMNIAPDGSTISIVVRNMLTARASLWRFDCLQDQWVDHDAAAAGVQPLSTETNALVPLGFDRALANRDGSGCYLVGIGGSVRLDFDLGSAAFTAAPCAIPAVPLGHQFVGLSASGRFLVDYVGSFGTQGSFALLDVATGTQLEWPVPVGSALGAVAWR